MKQTVFSNLLHEINSYIDQGNDAIKRGNEDESVTWYRKGLSLAIQAREKTKEKEISGLLIALY
jgi:hypothetical protein